MKLATQRDLDVLALNWQSYWSMRRTVNKFFPNIRFDSPRADLQNRLVKIYRIDDMLDAIDEIRKRNPGLSVSRIKELLSAHIPGEPLPGTEGLGVGFLTLAGVALVAFAIVAGTALVISAFEVGVTNRLSLELYYKYAEGLPPDKKAEAIKAVAPVATVMPPGAKAGVPIIPGEGWTDRMVKGAGNIIIVGLVVYFGGSYLIARSRERIAEAKEKYQTWKERRLARKAARAEERLMELRRRGERGEAYGYERPY